MKRESTIRREIRKRKTVSIEGDNRCSFTSLIQSAESLIEEHGGTLENVYFEAVHYDHGYSGEGVDITLSMEIDRTPEEIEEEFQRELELTRAQEAGDFELYKQLQKKFGLSNIIIYQ